MDQFIADRFVAISANLAHVSAVCSHAIPNENVTDAHRRSLKGRMDQVRQDCSGLPLDIVTLYLDRVEDSIARDELTYQEAGRLCRELTERFIDQLSLQCFLSLNKREADLYREPLAQWSTVIAAFPSSQIDIEEASKCLALNRYTAAVFHLMRALEPAFSAIARSLDISQHAPTWNAYLVAFRSAIDRQYPEKDKNATNQRLRAFYAGTEAHLRAMKDAWRNPTMHSVEIVYTDATAGDVYGAVRAFMRAVAEQLRNPDR